MKNLSIILLIVSSVGILGGIIIFKQGSAAGFSDVRSQLQMIGSAIALENIITLIIGFAIRKKSKV
jgi:hypothetical protein